MKKIVGILLAGAMVFSAFAADLTGGVRLAGELFNYNGTSEEVKALMLKNENQFWHAPLTLSISSDRAGGTFKMCDADSDTMKSGKWAIWFKPMDMLKVNLGTIDKSMNTESITYGNRVLNYDSFGASLDVNVDAFSATLSVVPGKGSYWFANSKANVNAAGKAARDAVEKELKGDDWDKTYDTTAKKEQWYADNKAALDAAEAAGKKAAENSFAELNLYAQYAADFGTISAMLDFSENFDKISIAAGYKNTFGDITMFADAAVELVKIANSFAVDADVVYAKDALNAQAYVKFTAPFKGIAKDTIGLVTLAKVSYNMGAFTPYLQFEDSNIMADDFACKIKPGVTGSVGIMNYEVAVQFDIADKVNVAVPVNFAVNF
jgi:hypothetical protein